MLRRRIFLSMSWKYLSNIIPIGRHRRIIEKMNNKPCYKRACILYDAVAHVYGVGYALLSTYANDLALKVHDLESSE